MALSICILADDINIILVLISGEELLSLWCSPSYSSGVLCGVFLFLKWNTSMCLLSMIVLAHSTGEDLLPAATAHPHHGVILQ